MDGAEANRSSCRSAAAPRLFDDLVRTDPSPAGDGEDSFTFMNRVDQQFWSRVRDQLEEWFADYPLDAAADLVGRFRDSDPRQHHAAWWELYLFTLYRRLGYSVTVHPTVAGTTAQPDFLVVRGDEELYVEAAVVFSGIVDEQRHAAREAWIYDLVNKATNPNFHVELEFDRLGTRRPKETELIRPLEQWLTGLDPDEVATAVDAGQEPPELYLPVRDWRLIFTALPVKPEHRGKPGRLLGIYPAMSGAVNDKEMARKTLNRKGSHYGRMDKPFVVALLCMSSFMEDNDIEQALFGSLAYQYYVNDPSREGKWVRQRDGFWMRGTQPRGTRVSAVLAATGLTPWRPAYRLPRLWLNPWATKPLTVIDPFPTATANDHGLVISTDTNIEAHIILGLPKNWPEHKPLFKRQ
jgi:hypothetical protein